MPEPLPDLPSAPREEPEAAAAGEDEPPPYPWDLPEWKRRMLDRLAETSVDYAARRRTFRQIVDDLQGSLPFTIDLRGKADDGGREHTVSFRGLSGDLVIAGLERLSRLTAWYSPGTIHLSPADEVPPPEGPEAIAAGIEEARRVAAAGGPIRPMLDRVLPVRFEGTPFNSAIGTIATGLRVPIEVTEEVPSDLTIDLVSDRMKAEDVLVAVAAAAKLGFAVEDRRIVVTEPNRAADLRASRDRAAALARSTVDLRFRDQPLAEAVRRLSETIGVPVYVDRALWAPEHPRVTSDGPPRELRRWLADLTRGLPARSVIRYDAVYLVEVAGK
jgi:hypothetical protein